MGKIAFSSLPDRLRTHITSINPGLLAKVTSALSVIVQHAAESGDGPERLIDYVDLMNMVMYKFQDDPIFRYDSFKWISLDGMDEPSLKDALSTLYISVREVFWDLDEEVGSVDPTPEPSKPMGVRFRSVANVASTPSAPDTVNHANANLVSASTPTFVPDADSNVDKPAEYDGDKILAMLRGEDNQPEADAEPKKFGPGYDLFFQKCTSDGIPITTDRDAQSLTLPEVPGTDFTKLFWSAEDWCGRQMDMYYTLPLIPKCQHDVSATTDVSRMIGVDFLQLYPDKIVRVRNEKMYYTGITTNYLGESIELDMDEVLGYIPRISGYSREQVIDNIIKYPMFTYWYRDSRGEYDRKAFLDEPELDGELLSREEWFGRYNEICDDLKYLPNHKAFVFDYQFRKYILDEEAGIKHKYPILGTYGPFMTLWLPPEVYEKFGYHDILGMAKQCVENRVEFYRSRNPVFMYAKRLQDSGIPGPVAHERRYCPFCAACDRPRCDYSCNRTSTLVSMMDLSEIKPTSLGKVTPEAIQMIEAYMDKFDGTTGMVLCNKDSKWLADLYTWVAICKLARYYGSDMTVFHLNFNQYMQNLRAGNWGKGESEKMSITRYLVRTVKVLVISGLEYIQWYDMESQTLMQLIGDRERNTNFSTVIVGKHPKDFMTPYTHRPFAAKIYGILEEIVSGKKTRW